MRIAFTTLACPGWDMGRIISAGMECGYDGIDFRGYLGESDAYKLPEFTTNAASTARKIGDAGLVVSAFSSGAKMYAPKESQRSAAIDEVKAYAQLCETFGAKYIRVFGGALHGTSKAEAVGVALETLEKMAAAADPLTVAVETHDDWADSSLMAKVFSRVKAKNVGVLWDLHHPYRFNGETPKQSYENIGRFVCYTHVKDSLPGEAGKPSRCTLPGEGDIPNAEMIEMLKAGGYDGWLTLEWEKLWHPEIASPDVALPAYAAFLKRFA